MLLENKYFLNERYIFDPNEKSLLDQDNDGDVTWLGNNESNILLAFINRPKEVLSRDKIHELVWTSNGFHVDESSVIQAISTVRKILKDSAKEPTFIKTIPKHGYQFIATSKKIENTSVANSAEQLNEGNSDQNKTEEVIEQFGKSKSYKDNFFINFILPFLILLVSLVLMLRSVDPKTVELHEVERIGDVLVVSTSPHIDRYLNDPSISYCINRYLDKVDDPSSIDKVVTIFTSQGDLLFNIINKVPKKSVTYKLITNSDRINICKEGF